MLYKHRKYKIRIRKKNSIGFLSFYTSLCEQFYDIFLCFSIRMKFNLILFVFTCLLAIVANNRLSDDKRNMINVDRQARAFITILDGGYSKDSWNIYFGGRKLDGASANSFKSLGGGGYGKDNWNVYFQDRKVPSASANSFESLGGGYGKDNWNVYFAGRKIDGASANSFRSLGGGYGKDNWNVYLMGEKIPGASPHSFQFGGMG